MILAFVGVRLHWVLLYAIILCEPVSWHHKLLINDPLLDFSALPHCITVKLLYHLSQGFSLILNGQIISSGSDVVITDKVKTAML